MMEQKPQELFKTPKISGSSSSNYLKSSSNNNNNINAGSNVNNNLGAISNDQNLVPKENNKDLLYQQQQPQYQMQVGKEQRGGPQEEELPNTNTWKRGPLQIKSQKLPPAFGSITSNPKKNKNQGFPPNGSIGSNSNNNNINGNAVKNLDEIESINEYQNIQKMLSPIQQEKSKPQNEKKQKGSQNSNKNPLGPLKRYIVDYQQMHLDMIDLSVDKDKINNLVLQHQQQQETRGLLNSKLKLEEMITLGILRGSRNTGVIKKMLHVPTLKIYTIKEEPISNKDVRNNLRDWISYWQNTLKENNTLFVKVYNTYWNTPEGCVSILMENANAGSLQNLLSSVGTLPEKVIKDLSVQILNGLHRFHIELNKCHGDISPSQILLNLDGMIKISLGIFYRVSFQNNYFTSLQQLKGMNDKLSLYDPAALNAPNIWAKGPLDKNVQKSEAQDMAEDIFKFGLLMLICSIGSFDLFEHQQMLLENIKYLIDEQTRANSQTQCCCLIHSEDLILQMGGSNNNIDDQQNNGQSSSGQQQQQQQQQQQSNMPDITINSLIQNQRLSSEFISFLCGCLKFDYRKRLTIEQLINHPFITNKKCDTGPKVTLMDLIKISTDWTRVDLLPTEFQGASERILDKICDGMQLVLPNCEQWFKSNNITYTKHMLKLSKDSIQIMNISRDLGLNPQKVYEKVSNLFEQFAFFQDFKKKNKQLQQQ